MGLFVVGMHRSGTSATTEALATLPFELPDESELVGGDESNPRGHFEVLALMDLTEELLTRAGGAWFAPTRAAIASIEELVDPTYGLEPRARRAFQESYATNRWLMKDPRLCLTLPFWRRVAPAPQAGVFVRRDPLSIAQSIRDRNGLALRHGVAVWERYTRTALAGLAGLPVFVIDYDDVLADAEPVGDLIDFAATQLGAAAGDLDGDERRRRFIGVLEPSLRHHTRRPDDHGEVVLTAQQRTLVETIAALDGAHESFDPPRLGRETPGLDLVFEAAVALHDKVESARSDGFTRGHESILDQFRASEAAYEDRLQEARDYIDEQRQALEDTRQRLDEEHEALARVEADAEKELELIRQDRAVVETQHLDEIERLRSLMAASEADLAAVDHLRHEMQKLQVEADTAVHTRNLTAQELGDLRARPAVKWAVRIADRLGSRAAPVAESDTVDESPPAPRQPDWDHVRQELAAGTMRRPLTVIVPIFNAVDAVQRCLEALDRFTPADVDIVLVDDCSTDPRMSLVLDQVRNRPGLRTLHNEHNLGFPGTVNRGLAEAPDGDVIVLNSDTQVTPRWTERLRLAAIERPHIATVTPLSDHAGVFSFASPRPTGLDHGAAIAARVARASRYLRPVGPTGNGFCLFIRAEARAVVSTLDAEAFPRGYGEENDFCMKLDAAGFEHVVADDTVVFHEESASFGDAQREALIADGLAVLDTRYPDYRRRAQEFVASAPFGAARRIAGEAAMAEPTTPTRPRVLHVLHEGGGGTEFFARDLAEVTAGRVEPILLTPDGQSLRLWRYEGPQWVVEREWQLSRPWDIREFRSDEAAAIVLEVLTRYDISLVHVQHLIGLTFDLPEIAAAINIPVVMSLHDFYLACPSVNLLDDQLRYCRGVCTEGEGRCPTPVFLPDDLPLKHRFVHLWRHETTQLFDTVPRFVAPSADTRDRYVATFGADVAPRIQVIEHGRDFDRQRSFARTPREDEPISLLLVGGINRSKGATLVEGLAHAGRAVGVRLESLGAVEPGYQHLVHGHGQYERDELMAKLAVIRPTFIGIFSLWPETHCYVLSEAWAAGIPVITGPLGAPAERVLEHGGGIVVDELDPELIVQTALTYGRDRRAYADLARTASLANVRSRAAMAVDWLDVYDELSRDVAGWTT